MKEQKSMIKFQKPMLANFKPVLESQTYVVIYNPMFVDLL